MGPAEQKTNYGRRLLASIVDSVAAADPERPFIYVPRSSDPRQGWKPITYREVAHAIDHVAWRIASSPRPSTLDPFPTVAYIGPSDVRYIIIMLACIKAGYKALFISPRNTLEAQLSLLEATDCSVLWHADTFREAAALWAERIRLETVEVPAADVLLSYTPEPFPYSREVDEGRHDPAVVLHTSGSTGIPKPIVVRQGNFVVQDAFHDLPEFHGCEFFLKEFADRADRIFLPMPLFHAAAMVMVGMSIQFNTPLALSIPGRPVNSDLVADCLENADVQGTFLPPVIVDELSQSERGISALSRLNYVAFGGGNLAKEAGDRLADRGVLLANVVAATESFPYPLYFQRDPKLWQYFIIDSERMGSDWRPYAGTTDVFELVVKRKDPRDPGDQGIFYTFPEKSEWSTNDLYKAHPTLADHWIYRGRADTVLVFSTGEKLNPVTLEDRIGGHLAVKGALVVGQDRFQPALILEPAVPCEDDAAAEAFINDVWPSVERANAETVAHGRIVRRYITVAKSVKPFPRAAKGTIQRGAATKLYEVEIDELYLQPEPEREVAALDLTSQEALVQSILDLFRSEFDVRNLEADTDFFSSGIDSLQVISGTGLLRSGLRAAGIPVENDALAPRDVYANPTPTQLAGHLFSVVRQENTETDAERQVRVMKDLLAKYTRDLPAPNPTKPQPRDEGQTVVLTGSTGSLGAYMLDCLCKTDSVRKVVALNRGQDGGRSRQPAISTARGLDTDFSKVEFLGSDLSLPDLGLGKAKYEELLATADRIVHNAWPVNFNISVASFEPYVRGVRHLVDLAAAAERAVALVMISSIGEVDGWTASGSVPEEKIEDLALPLMGYGRSKLLGSLIVDAAARQSGIPGASVRVGQIAGPKGKEGMWNAQEFLPSLIASSVHLGILPDNLGPQQVVDWVPVEDVARMILDVVGVTERVPASEIKGYFHAVNPVTTVWTDMAAIVKEYYGERIKQLVSLGEFVARLEESASKGTDVDKNPGVKLLDTYRGFLAAEQAGQGHVMFEMERTKSRSPTARNLDGITPALMRNWCEQWAF